MNKQYTVLALQALGANQMTGGAAGVSSKSIGCSSKSNRQGCNTGGGTIILGAKQDPGKAMPLR